MVSLRNIANYFHRPTQAQPTSNLPAVIAQPTKTEILKQKVQSVWDHFLCALHLRNKIVIAAPTERKLWAIERISAKMAGVDTKNQNKTDLCNSIRDVYQYAIQTIQTARLDPIRLPKEVALQLSEIIGRFGIAIYANKDVCTGLTDKEAIFKASFQYSLTTMKTAIVMQQYALGLSGTSPDITKAKAIDDLYKQPALVNANTVRADGIIDNLSSAAWAEKASGWSLDEQILLNNVLRYTNGAERYLKMGSLVRSANLIETAEAVLQRCQQNKGFDQVEVDNELAELYYNDMTGLLASKAGEFDTKGETELAAATRSALADLWETCAKLSKNPEQMRARCDNKRTFVEKLTLQEEEALRLSSLQRHLSLPEEKQSHLLIALSYNNLADLYARIEKEETDQEKKINAAVTALYLSLTAAGMAEECIKKGQNNVQFDGVIENAKKILMEYGGILQALAEAQAEEDAAVVEQANSQEPAAEPIVEQPATEPKQA